MIYLLSMLLQLSAPAMAESISCVTVKDKPKFKSIELKMNLDGNGKPDVLAVYDMGGPEMQGMCVRKALIFDAPEKLGEPTTDQWLGSAEFTDLTLQAERREFEKLAVGDRDILHVTEEVGTFQSHVYYLGEAGKLKKMLAFGHPQWDGQLTETYNKKAKKLSVRIFDSGTFEVNGAAVDLDQKSIKSRCRVRELFIQLKYEWDSKEHQFRLADEGCVMGQAID